MVAEFSHRSLHGAKSGRRRLLAATTLVVVLFVLDVLSGGSVRSMVRTFSAHLWNGTAQVRASILDSGYFASHRALGNENASLRAQLAQYEEKAAAYEVVASENAELRSMLHLAGTQKGITAPVVSSFTSSPYGTFLIGAGTDDAVAEGDLVVSDEGFVIGVAADVHQHTTAVRGVFSAGEETNALIGTNAAAVLGVGGGNARATVSRSASVRVGDPVISAQYGGRAIGIVGHVESSPTSADQSVYISLPINLSTLRYVYILHG